MSATFEPSSLKVFEHSFYVGNYLGGILFGVNLTVYFLIMRGLFNVNYRGSTAKRHFHSIFSTVMILLVATDISVTAIWGEEMWIVRRDEPGGVPLFILTENSIWYETLGTTCTFTMVLLADVFLLYRLFVIFEMNLAVVIFPCLALIAAFVLSVIQVVIAIKPHADFFHGKNVDFGTPYYSITLGFNIIVTSLIVFRLRKLSKNVTDILGRENARVYTNISAMLIESAAPYALFGMAWIVPYVIGHPTAICFGYVSGKLSCLSPLLIIHRVVNRTAWDSELVSKPQSRAIEFNRHSAAGARTTAFSRSEVSEALPPHMADLRRGSIDSDEEKATPKVENSNASIS